VAIDSEGTPVRLFDALREQMRCMHYSVRTEQTYVRWVRTFIRFHGLRHPSELARPELKSFLPRSANERGKAPATHKPALAALLSLYQKVLRQDLPWAGDRPPEAAGAPAGGADAGRAGTQVPAHVAELIRNPFAFGGL
jgi:hypothetical protein